MSSSGNDDVELDPQPGFVVKTLVVNGKRQGVKVFINVCSDPRIPEPPQGYTTEALNAVLNDDADDDYIVPIVLSRSRLTADKRGRESLVWDCCMHPRVIVESIKKPELKVLMVETCLELVESRETMVLSREYSTPKMVQKGELERTVLKRADLGATTEPSVVEGVDEFAKRVLDDPSLSPSSLAPKQPESKKEAVSQKPSKPLIQVLSSSTSSTTTTTDEALRESSSSQAEEEASATAPGGMTYTVTPFDGAAAAAPPPGSAWTPPRYRVDIVAPWAVADKVQLDSSGSKLMVPGDGGGPVMLPCTTRYIEAYYANSTKTTHVFVY